MSEAPSIAAASLPIVHRVPGAVGVARCEIRTVDEQGNALGQHETGEIVVRGPRVFPGYLDDPEATAAAFLPGGWFRTGDVGFLDDGRLLAPHWPPRGDDQPRRERRSFWTRSMQPCAAIPPWPTRQSSPCRIRS